MEERYPFIRFVIDAAPFIAGAVALAVLLGVAAVVYVAVMVRVESLKVLLDIEQNSRERLTELRRPPAVPPPERMA